MNPSRCIYFALGYLLAFACKGQSTDSKRAAERSIRTAPSPNSVTRSRNQAVPSNAPRSAAQVSVTYPVRWSDWLELDSLAEVDARWIKKDEYGFGELEGDGQKVRPFDCKQWNDLRKRGYVPSTTLEEQADGGALVICRTLQLLKRARPTQTSFVRDLRFSDPSILKILPAMLATAESSEQVARVKAASSSRISLAVFDPKARLRKRDGLDLVLEDDGQSSIRFQPEAWGDFDGDGGDDVALSVVNSMTYGSLATTRLVVVTRNNPSSVLRVVKSFR